MKQKKRVITPEQITSVQNNFYSKKKLRKSFILDRFFQNLKSIPKNFFAMLFCCPKQSKILFLLQIV